MKYHFWHSWKYVVVDGVATERSCSHCPAKQVYCKNLPRNLQRDGVTEGWLDVK